MHKVLCILLINFTVRKGAKTRLITLLFSMKKSIALLTLIFYISVFPLHITFAYEDNFAEELTDIQPSVIFDSFFGENPLTEPIVLEDDALVSAKELANAFKVKLDWISEDQTIILERDSQYVHLGIGKKHAFINGSKTELNYAPIINNGIGYIPLRFVAEAFGYNISVDSTNKNIRVDSSSLPQDGISVSGSVYYYSNSEPFEIKDIKVIDSRVYINTSDFDMLTGHKMNLKFFPNSRIFLVDGSATYIDTKTESIESCTYVPLAALAKSLGIKVFWGNNTKTVHIYYTSLKNLGKDIGDLVPEHFVYGNVKDKTPIYNATGGKISSYLPKGKVEIIRDKDYKWYYIKSGNISGWTKKEYLSIDTKFTPSQEKLFDSETEYFANDYFKLSSQTNYLIWVDLNKQLINVFNRDGDKWKIERKIPCATGKNISPTIKGTFTINGNRGTWMPAGSSVWVKNYVGFYSSYFFHSVKVKKDGKIYDGTLGTVASAGCIRMPLNESEWFYHNIPDNTTVFIR